MLQLVDEELVKRLEAESKREKIRKNFYMFKRIGFVWFLLMSVWSAYRGFEETPVYFYVSLLEMLIAVGYLFEIKREKFVDEVLENYHSLVDRYITLCKAILGIKK